MNRIEPLNVCRRMLHLMTEREGIYTPAFDRQERLPQEKLDVIAHLCMHAAKFTLPMNGELLVDPEYRALDEAMELHLPFPLIALEFRAVEAGRSGNLVVFAIEGPKEITVAQAAVDTPVPGFWAVGPSIAIPKRGFMERGPLQKPKFLTLHPMENDGNRLEAFVLLAFLNALQCSNVHIQNQPARKVCKKAKNALPFDSYHQLVIDVPRAINHTSATTSQGERRAAREHLRRGHIVRPEGKRPYWRNATVVNAGMKSKVGKDYAVRAAS